MVSSRRISAMVAASIMSLASAQTIPTPTYTGALNAMTAKGCFSDPTPLVNHGSYIYQTSGNCQPICVGLGMPVMGLVNGTNCWCGPELPSKDSQVDSDECSTPCSGYDKDTCGGPNLWQVWLTGYTKNKIDYYSGSTSDSSSSSSSQQTSKAEVGAAVTSIVQEGTTIVKTIQAGTATGSSSSSGGGGGSTNTAGIAAGVVVGVVGLAAIAGGAFFFMRYRRRRSVEEEYRRQAAVNDFVGGGKPPHTSSSSMTDSRLDPEVMLARRQSDGSIADNQDYSRRILRVANPDGL